MRSVCSRRSDASVAKRTFSAVSPLRSRFEPDLGREHDRVAGAALGHPASDDLLALAPAVAGHPLRVVVSGVDEVAAGGPVGVEHGERTRARRPSSRRRSRPGSSACTARSVPGMLRMQATYRARKPNMFPASGAFTPPWERSSAHSCCSLPSPPWRAPPRPIGSWWPTSHARSPRPCARARRRPPSACASGSCSPTPTPRPRTRSCAASSIARARTTTASSPPRSTRSASACPRPRSTTCAPGWPAGACASSTSRAPATTSWPRAPSRRCRRC